MHSVFYINEKLKDELVEKHGAVFAHTSWHKNGMCDIPVIGDILKKSGINDVPYLETVVGWKQETDDETLELAYSCIFLHRKSIDKKKNVIMTDVISESNNKGFYYSWAIFLENLPQNDLNLG